MIYDILLIASFIGVTAGLWLVFRKAGVAPWKAVVPFYNIVVWIRLCGKSWRWWIYMLVPGVNIFCFMLLVQETARVFRRYAFWEQLVAVLFPYVYLPWLGIKAEPAASGAASGDGATRYFDPRVDPPMRISEGRDWGEAVLFGVIAAVIIRASVFELYEIPSSSMEKSLLVGDHLLVSKMAYGPRAMMTPLALPLMHNDIPILHGKSYLDWPLLPFHRFSGYTSVKRFDAVVFNFPAGDTICTGYPTCLRTYYDLVDELGRDAVWSGQAIDRYGTPVGDVMARPLDRRENYIKRCVGLPGEDLQIIEQALYIDGKPVEPPSDAQVTYSIIFRPGINPMKLLDELGVSRDDLEIALSEMYRNNTPYMNLPLTRSMAARLKNNYAVLNIEVAKGVRDGEHLYADSHLKGWTVDNYGPIHIPAEGETLILNDSTLPYYTRVITAYEGNSLEVRDGKIFINGQQTDSYTVKQNYYWMMGDNRHNSQDSRYWGYVPEDHISGKARWILWSWDKDHKKVRWNRTFSNACAK